MAYGREKRFEPMLIAGMLVTLVLHVGAVVGILLYRSSLASAKKPPPPVSYVVAKLIRKGVPKPKKKLPDKIVPTAPTKKVKSVDLTADASAKPNTKKKKKRDRHAKISDKQRDALKKMEALAKAQRDIQQEGSKHGVVGGSSSARAGDKWITRIASKWIRTWSLPAVIPRDKAKKLFVHVVLTLDKNGKILKVKFDRRSGNQHFDSSIFVAWKRIGQLPAPPPDRLASILANGLALKLTWKGLR